MAAARPATRPRVDRSGDVHEAAPTDTHEICDSPDRAWSVGDNAQLVPTSRAFLIGYDATLYSRCNSIKTDDHYYAIGRYVRLREQ